MLKEDIIEFLEETFIPNNVYCKKTEFSDGEVEYQKMVPLYTVVNLKLNAEEKQYVTKYLTEKGIKVIGYSNKIDFESDDYLYTRKYRGRNPESMSKEETLEKLKLYQETHDINIRNEIVIGNMRLVNFAIINMNNEYHSNVYDLEQAGYIALIKAVENYSFDKGAFSTFAMSYINGFIRMQLYQIRGFKRSEYNFYLTIREVEEEYCEKIFDNPALAEIVVDRIVEKEIRNGDHKEENMRRVLINNPVSLDEILENDDECFLYPLGYEVEDNFENEVYDKELVHIIEDKMQILNDKKRKVLAMRYGLNGDNELRLKDIAEELDVSTTAVGNLIDRSFKEMEVRKGVKKLGYYLHREI